MSIIAPKNVPGSDNNDSTPVQPQQMPAIPGSPPGVTYGPETDEQRAAREGDLAARRNDPTPEPAVRVTPEAPVAPVAPQRGK